MTEFYKSEEAPYEEKDVGATDHIAPASDALDLEVDPQESAKVRRKVDFCLLPLLCTVYALQFLDKTCMSSAAVMGFLKDLHLTGDQYSWLGSIFYLGYLVGEYPLNFGLHKFPLAKYTSVMIIIWGAILCLMAVGGSFRGLMVIRFFLGFFESVITPALTTFTSQYYRVSEQGTRTGIWFSFNASGSIVGGLLGYGLLHGQRAGTLAIAGWKLVFIILGAFTSFVGIVFLVWVPDSPDKARFLNEKEKKVALQRVVANKTGAHAGQLKPDQIKEALLDPMTWLYSAVAMLTSIPNGGITNFFAILIQGFGFSTYDTLLLGMASSWLAIIMILTLWLGDKTKNRALAALFPCAVSIIGSSLVWKLPVQMRIGRLIGFYLTLPFVVPMPVCLSFISSNVAGRTKRTVVSATFLVAYCVGNLIGPQTFRAKYAPTYAPALATIVGCNAAVLVCMVSIRLMYTKRNAQIDEDAVQEEDMTDRKNKAFRYTL